MDRNLSALPLRSMLPVALRKESVDRNNFAQERFHQCRAVALRKESVDRNWRYHQGAGQTDCVALRKESVDRNTGPWPSTLSPQASLSARRAWIEIIKKGRARRPGQVALRKESVDRNADFVLNA